MFFIPIDKESIFDYPIFNIKIPELDNIVFKMSKVSEIDTNNRKYAVYNPVVNRGYFANEEKTLDLLNIRYLDFFNYPIMHNKLKNHDIISVNNVEFKNGFCFLYIDPEYNDIIINDSIQIKQVLNKNKNKKNNNNKNNKDNKNKNNNDNNDNNDIKFIFNNENHIVENIEIIENKSGMNQRIQIKYPKSNLQGISVKNINNMRKTLSFILCI